MSYCDAGEHFFLAKMIFFFYLEVAFQSSRLDVHYKNDHKGICG